ncbi:GntR family transcriptional regulator [Cupriavidus sp. AcVe19-6a]|uniref:GntR family transcriptional regulator n=1 Tax=Cupriavidus sp. AcVe19-6a TaxID=2821358 RepID=UPI001AE4E62B|nr:GntR family transcriptional regulator [Cupriavidus sp. AcVe19-6a]MBP0637990.1 GntR family transcriptional regulator [Cupriavidus sp. AcVe19-6a]
MSSLRKERVLHDEAESLTLPESAYRMVRGNILDNRWPPGFQATEQEVASQLNMSRTPVREALLRLQQEGLVEVVPRHGMHVLPVSPADMKEIYEVLTSLESTAAELAAARRLSSEELRPLEEASDAMDAALKRDDLDGWARADEAFHAQLLSLSGNRMLKQMVLNTWDRAHRARMVTLRLRAKPVHSTREHRDLLKAIRNGDPAAAREVQRAHRERAGKELLELLQRLGLQHL